MSVALRVLSQQQMSSKTTRTVAFVSTTLFID
jgi:hypothetical protein